MNSALASPGTTSRGKTIALWVAKALVALLFLASGVMKLVGPTMAVEEFNQIGLGQSFRIITGLIEITGAVLLLVPRTAFYGAGLLFCVSTGALFAPATILHGDVIHTLVLMVITALLAWFSRPAVARSVPAISR